jgi:hypothetical protein
MYLAKELGKSLEEILDISVLEFRMWVAFFKLENEKTSKQQQTMRKGRRGN